MGKGCWSGSSRDLAAAVRRDVLDMTAHAGVNGGHIGGALSCADILAVLYGEVLDVSPAEPEKPTRDRFLLSKGHVTLALYAVLAECGFLTREEMMSFEDSGGAFPTHAVMAPQKGIEISSGSLGWGLSIGVGCALAAKIRGQGHRVYVLLGDGECNEGTVWEAAMSAARFALDDLTVIVDVNGQQLDGYTADVMPLHDVAAVFRGFGFHVTEVDGNDPAALLRALQTRVDKKPAAVIARTKKGKGIKTIEGKTGWHHAVVTQEQYDAFVKELEEDR